jgi:dipeptidyl aminopeptidase/acylaminoacyl peptidase
VGFGQEFSAYHVNDWGMITSKEIITGVKKMLAAHPFIDPKRVGAIGASYGGFMTMLLGTKTDIFSALISHAGISALSSYWGVGDWGYSYSAVATANSFPWNRKDIYVGHSPLFMAERYTTPLLLLHGDIDNNVPPGESYQMYAALKLLGKEVALVTFNDQQHWILSHDQRVQWMKTIIAWYDRYLKGQPEYWEHLYGKDSANGQKNDK